MILNDDNVNDDKGNKTADETVYTAKSDKHLLHKSTILIQY